jgi:hypothetical protein
VRSSPPDTMSYSRPLIPEDLDPLNTGSPSSPVARHHQWEKPETSPMRKPHHSGPEAK